TEEDVRIVRGLVAQFDGATNPLELVVRRFELDKGNAREIADMIEGVLAGESLTGTRITDRQATKLSFYRSELAEGIEEITGQEPTETEIDNVIRQQVTLTPELRTNSIFVKAPAEVMDFIAALIDEIDASDEGIRQIAQFKLENADAYQMATLLEDLFRVNRSDDVLYPTESGPQPQDRDPDWFGRQVTPLQDPRSELSITVDARTNTLLISGTEEYLELVREIVVELDAKDANERTTNVIELQNADAAEVQATLENFFRGEANRLNSILGDEMRGSLARQLEREVTVVGDPSSNKLIIAASPRYIDMVSTIVEELDAAPPQVMIQVLLAEVTLDSGNTWGVDVDVGPIGGQGYTFGSLAAGSGVAAALGVPNLSFGAADFNILIRSLQQQGKLEVLSEPKVTVNNNQQANINVGENIAIVSGVDRFSDGNSSANVERRDVGIILDVLPSISSDGFVRMDIRPEISSVSQRTDQISADVTAPRINTRSVETTVTVRDGQTVVIGGLFQTTQEERETSVPIIGEVPILGLPFRSKQVSQVKTELLVILTPHVIPGGDGRSADRFQSMPLDDMSREDLTRDALQNLTNPDPILRMLLEGDGGDQK
ncbi:MAG: hypothetical protein KDA28_05850, partial [Phycisphaerales bacterium]|nr:hypothetical protein [Phycisphaerales bacterium]